MATESKTLTRSIEKKKLDREFPHKAFELAPQDNSMSPQSLNEILNDLPNQFFADILQLKKKLSYIPGQNNAQVFALCSSNSGEGTSTIAHTLALMLALNNSEFEAPGDGLAVEYKNGSNTSYSGNYSKRSKVAVIDANLNAPILHDFMHVSRKCGLVEYLEDHQAYSQTLKWVVEDRLAFITAGRQTEYGIDLFYSNRFKELLTKLRSEFQFVILDCSPINLSPDIVALIDAVDGVVLTVQADKTNVSDVLKSRFILQKHGASNVGVVLNRYQQKIPDRLNRTFY